MVMIRESRMSLRIALVRRLSDFELSGRPGQDLELKALLVGPGAYEGRVPRFPRTAVLGAILLTAYMGGAIASQLRIGRPIVTHVLFGVYLAVLSWGGLYPRDPQVRALMFS